MQNKLHVEGVLASDSPLYSREFPGFELDFELPEGFEDTSWHNNEMPSFDKVQPDGTILKLWVDFSDRSNSTLPQDKPYFRFSLARYSANQDWIGHLAFASTPKEAIDVVAQFDGPLLLRMHGGLFETLGERVEFDLDNTPLHGDRLSLVADALHAFVASPSFAVDCYLVGADPHNARLHLKTMRASIKNHGSVVL